MRLPQSKDENYKMRPPNLNPTNQLVFFVNYNTVSIEILLSITTHNSEHKIEIKKSRKEKKEEKKRKQFILKLHM